MACSSVVFDAGASPLVGAGASALEDHTRHSAVRPNRTRQEDARRGRTLPQLSPTCCRLRSNTLADAG